MVDDGFTERARLELADRLYGPAGTPPPPTREPGYYWVREGTAPLVEAWYVAQWTGRGWLWCGTDDDSGEPDHVGPMIQPPKAARRRSWLRGPRREDSTSHVDGLRAMTPGAVLTWARELEGAARAKAHKPLVLEGAVAADLFRALAVLAAAATLERHG